MTDTPLPNPPRARVPGLQGHLRFNVPMSRYTSWRVGGSADRLYTPANLDDLCAFLRSLDDDEPVHFIGLGSNLLVRDGGVRGTVIHLHGALGRIHLEQRRPNGAGEDASRYGVIFAEAGVASPKVARFAANHGLVGAEFLAGVPGTVGGALAMNAGCYGHETWEYVTRVLTVDRRGELARRAPGEYRVGYRHAELRADAGDTSHPGLAPLAPRADEWFVAAWFMLPRGDGEASRAEIKRLLQKRIDSQPLDQPNAGSVFRNPPGDHAARLIESCGLKGLRVGGAQVSPKHANFIVNLGTATAGDIEQLIDRVQQQVELKTGVRLLREVRILGERA
jgi:UDP-N-acetylmuramate dehydrogenase